MPHEGYANLVTNDGPRFHSNIPDSELTEHVTRAIEASDVSSTPSVAETTNRVTIIKTTQPSTGPRYTWGLKESWTRKETERAVAERQTPVGVRIRKDLF